MKNNNDIGVYGLGIMGKNIALNIASKNFTVSVYNRNTNEKYDIVKDFISTENTVNIQGFFNIREFVLSLKRPRKILIMVTSGSAVDEVICQIMRHMDSDDIIIDGGNSNYLDTQERVERYNIRYLGCGISGGWSGALNGPSMMLGGSNSAWLEVRNLFQEIASKRENQTACCNWFGKGGSGHFIKMIHNGIEYAMMQSIAEAYDMLRKISSMSNNDISLVFKKWNDKELNSYLMEVSSEVLLIKDKDDCLIDNIIDRSSQKGTGIDFAICSLKYGVSTPTIIEAINARFISRSKYRKQMPSVHSYVKSEQNSNNISKILFDSVFCCYVIAFFQGLSLIQRVSDVNSWGIDLMEVASVWEDGCIIKASIFKKLSEYLDTRSSIEVLLEGLKKSKIKNLSKIVNIAMINRVPAPVFSSSLNYYHSIYAGSLPANLIQLQREEFGSHGFEKVGHPGQMCHFIKR
jgi:6-phosphogluconate dehydrogenase